MRRHFYGLRQELKSILRNSNPNFINLHCRDIDFIDSNGIHVLFQFTIQTEQFIVTHSLDSSIISLLLLYKIFISSISYCFENRFKIHKKMLDESRSLRIDCIQNNRNQKKMKNATKMRKKCYS